MRRGRSGRLELGPRGEEGMIEAGERKLGQGGLAVEDLGGEVLAEGGGELEAGAGAAGGEPDVRGLRMAVGEETAVEAVLVLADARLDDGGAGELREAVGQVAAGAVGGRRSRREGRPGLEAPRPARAWA